MGLKQVGTMQITIKNAHNLPTVDYRWIKQLQGNLKFLPATEYAALVVVLKTRGFDLPFFVWQDPADNVLWMIDGHQRQKVMIKNDMNDQGSYVVPYYLVPAASLAEARERLLEVTSQYGKITQEGLDEFGADLNLGDLNISFDRLPDFSMNQGKKDEDPEPDEDGEKEPDPAPAFAVIVTCQDAEQQQTLDAELRGRGLSTRLATVQIDEKKLAKLLSKD